MNLSTGSHDFGQPADGYTTVTNLSQLSLTDTASVPRVHNWLIANWSLLMATHFGATLPIEYRFWRSARWAPQGMRSSCLSIIWIVFESGTLPVYSAMITFLLDFSSKSTGACLAAALDQISARTQSPTRSPWLCATLNYLLCGNCAQN